MFLPLFPFLYPLTRQIVTDQQTGQKIQIVRAMDPSSAPKQQFILTTADSLGASKVILASPETHNTKQVIFTAADSLRPGRIQVRFSNNLTFQSIVFMFSFLFRCVSDLMQVKLKLYVKM